MAGILIGDGSDDYNKTIDRIIELKSFRLYNIETNQNLNIIQKGAMTILKEQFEILRERTRALYLNFNDNRLTFESDENFLTGVVSNQAVAGEYEIEILNLAQPEILSSDSHLKEPNLPAGKLVFQVDEEVFLVTFTGGSPRELAREINVAANNFLSANWLKKNYKESIFILSGKQAGRRYQISILEDPSGILTKLKLFSTVNLDEFKNKPLTQQHEFTVKEDFTTTNFQLASEVEVDFSEVETLYFYLPVADEGVSFENLTLNYLSADVPGEGVKTVNLKALWGDNEEKIKLTKQHFEGERITMKGWDFSVKLPKITNNISISNNMAVSNDISKSINVALKPAEVTNEVITNMGIAIQPPPPPPTYSVVIGKMTYDLTPPTGGKFQPINVIQEGLGAQIKFQSIVLERDENEINDLITGVSLKLIKPKEGPIKFSVSQNNQALRDRMISFVGQYNNTMEYINIFQAISLDALGVDDLEPKLLEKLGSLRNEFWLTRTKDRIRRLLLQDYFIGYGGGTVFMSDLGMENNYTFARPNHFDSDKIKFDETKFNAVAQDQEKVKLMMSIDSDEDGQFDNGYAWQLNEILSEVLSPNSFIGLYISTRENENKELAKSYIKEQEKIKEERAKLEIDFGKIEQVKKQQEQVQGMFQNFGQ